MTRHYLLTTVCAMLLLAAGVGAVAAEDAKPQAAAGGGDIAALVELLDSNRYRERERATQALLEAGRAALDPLVAAANGDRPEPADRAVWVLKKLGDSADRDLALAALDGLVQVKDRPAVVVQARQLQSRLRLAVCEELLANLGGRLSVADYVLPDVGPIHLVRVELGDDWRGAVDDLQCLLALDQHHYFRLVGSAVDNEEVQLFEAKDDLRLLQVFMSRATPPAVDSLKERHPLATVYVRNRALLGIVGDSQANGVRVVQAQENYGAARSGIVVGDVVTTIDGKPIKDFDRLTALIAQHQPGDEVEVVILRGDKTLTKRVTLSDQPPEP
jgi:hypothetical protein